MPVLIISNLTKNPSPPSSIPKAAAAMATISLFSSSIFLRARFHSSSSASALPLCLEMAYPSRLLRKKLAFKRMVRAVADEETLAPATDPPPSVDQAPSAEETVFVPISPSDVLTMFFKAEGTMGDMATSKISKALEGIDGVGDLKVEIIEGIASVELTQQTTVQATGVASNLVEIIQGAGFRLQTLNLSFEDEEDAIN